MYPEVLVVPIKMVSPLHNDVAAPASETGNGFTNAVTVSLSIQPNKFVVTIKSLDVVLVVPLVNVTVGFDEVLLLNPDDGLHE